MLAMMLLTALPGGVVLTAPPDPPGPHLPARPGPIRAPALGQAIVSPRRRQPQRDGAITGPSVPLGQSELIIGTERIVGVIRVILSSGRAAPVLVVMALVRRRVLRRR